MIETLELFIIVFCVFLFETNAVVWGIRGERLFGETCHDSDVMNLSLVQGTQKP